MVLYKYKYIYILFRPGENRLLFFFFSSTFTSYLYRKTKRKRPFCVTRLCCFCLHREDFERAKRSQKRSIVPDRQKRQGRERLLLPLLLLLHTHTDPYIAGSGNSISVSSRVNKRNRHEKLPENQNENSCIFF